MVWRSANRLGVLACLRAQFLGSNWVQPCNHRRPDRILRFPRASASFKPRSASTPPIYHEPRPLTAGFGAAAITTSTRQWRNAGTSCRSTSSRTLSPRRARITAGVRPARASRRPRPSGRLSATAHLDAGHFAAVNSTEPSADTETTPGMDSRPPRSVLDVTTGR